jgi:hypothetical protein
MTEGCPSVHPGFVNTGVSTLYASEDPPGAFAGSGKGPNGAIHKYSQSVNQALDLLNALPSVVLFIMTQ